MTTPTTVLLPTPPPTTHPLGWGEGVYKKSSTLTYSKVKSLMGAFPNHTHDEIVRMFLGPYERPARLKSTGQYIGFHPTLGMVESERIPSEPDAHKDWRGYYVNWLDKSRDWKNFEYEEVLISINDIIPLTNQQFVEEIRDGKMVQWGY